MAGFWQECWNRLPRWPSLVAACPGPPCVSLSRDKTGGSSRQRAERDIWRLKWNWLFAMLVSMIESLNVSCVLPTNHRYVINPTPDNLNQTDENIEPGLQLGEDFYSLSYSMLFVGNSAAAIACGLLFNLIPTWYLFLSCIFIHITSYTFYSLATAGWMMLLSRTLAGLAMGSSVTLTFSYFGVSHFKYVEDLKEVERYEEKAAARTKGFIFSLYNIGNLLGYAIGGGFPIILAQFPETPQFRPAGWFCVAAGVALLLLLLLLFHGECAWNCSGDSCPTILPKSCSWRTMDIPKFCSVFVPVFLIVIGGVKGLRYLIPTVMITPITSDSFGYSENDSAYLTTIFFVGTLFGIILTYILQFFKVNSYGLTVTGLVCTILAFLMMTDWQAIGNDPCTAYSILHHPQLLDYYREELRDSNVTLHHSNSRQYLRLCSTLEQSRLNETNTSNVQETTCIPTDYCDYSGSGGLSRVQAVFHVNYDEPQAEVCFYRIQSQNEFGMLRIRTTEFADADEGSTVHCTSGHEFYSSASSCFVMAQSNTSIDESILVWAHVQSLQVVEGEVYQMAVNRCESAGEHCHWIPNSQITHKHCSDCQPICRDSRHTLHFAQFALGLTFFFSTYTFLFTGFFLLLSDTVSKSFQALSIGLLVANAGLLKIVSPYWMFWLYVEAEMRTYLLMLTMVAIFLPLLLGLLFIHPWIREQISPSQDQEDDSELSELLPNRTSKDSDNR